MITQQRKEELIQLARENHQQNVTEITRDMTLEESRVFIAEVEKLDLELEIKQTANRSDIDIDIAELLVMSKQAHEYLEAYIKRQGLENTCASKMVDRLGDVIEKVDGDS